MGVAYLTIVNRGPRDDALVGASTSAAVRVSVHQTLRIGDVASMRAVAALPIPAGGTMRLSPGGAHLMLESLTHAARPGDRLSLTLRFARGAAERVFCTVGAGEGMAEMRM